MAIGTITSSAQRARKVAAKAFNSPKLVAAAALLSTTYFVIVTVLVSRELTFFWDDYASIGVIVDDHPLGQLFMGGAGHFGPLWRLFFTINTYLFDSTFEMYTALSAVLASAGFWGFAYSLKDFLRSYFWLSVPTSIIFFNSIGLYALTLVAVGSEFNLAFAFAGGAAYVYSRRRSIWLSLPLLLASALTLNGTFPLYYLMFMATVTTLMATQVNGRPTRKFVFFGTLGLFTTLIWAAIASVLGAINAIPYYALGAESAITVIETDKSVMEWLGELTTSCILFLTWTMSAFIPASHITPDFLSILLFFVAKYITLIVVGLVLAGLLMVRAHKRGAPTRQKSLNWILPFVWTLPILFWVVVTTLVRPDSLVIPRYAAIWLPPVLFFILVTLRSLDAAQTSLFSRILIRVGAGLICCSAILGAYQAFPSARYAADIDRPRIALSETQDRLMVACLDEVSVIPLDEISPQLSATEFCKVSRFLQR